MRSSIFWAAVAGTLVSLPLPAAPTTTAQPPVAIELSHHLSEEQAERLEPLVQRFNSENKGVQVQLVRRVEGEAPRQINLVSRDEHARFTANRNSFKPLFEVMREAKEPFDADKLSPELRDGLVDNKGRFFALPLAFSTPVLYINKAAFRQAGLDPENPPRTWMETQEVAGKLVDAGQQCAFTTSWPAWILIDNISAWNGAEVNDERGRLAFNGLLQVKHVAMMATWYKSRYFSYFGPRDEADRRFAKGECAMLTSSSSLFASLARTDGIDVGVSPLPYHDDAYGAPQNTLADGASLWIKSGMKPAETKAVAKFINYVLGPKVQIAMTLAGGFLPMTQVARSAAHSQVMKSELTSLDVAYAQLKGKGAAPKIRVSQFEPVRRVVEEELEAVWANRKPAKEALDNAVQRGNALLSSTRVATGKR